MAWFWRCLVFLSLQLNPTSGACYTPRLPIGSLEARTMKSSGKLVGMLGTGVLTLTLGCAVSVRAQEQGKQQQDPQERDKQAQGKDEMKKPASYQQAKLEQPQPGQRFQYASNSGVGLIPNDRF